MMTVFLIEYFKIRLFFFGNNLDGLSKYRDVIVKVSCFYIDDINAGRRRSIIDFFRNSNSVNDWKFGKKTTQRNFSVVFKAIRCTQIFVVYFVTIHSNSVSIFEFRSEEHTSELQS